jgi:hypothetical protein
MDIPWPHLSSIGDYQKVASLASYSEYHDEKCLFSWKYMSIKLELEKSAEDYGCSEETIYTEYMVPTFGRKLQ